MSRAGTRVSRPAQRPTIASTPSVPITTRCTGRSFRPARRRANRTRQPAVRLARHFRPPSVLTAELGSQGHSAVRRERPSKPRAIENPADVRASGDLHFPCPSGRDEHKRRGDLGGRPNQRRLGSANSRQIPASPHPFGTTDRRPKPGRSRLEQHDGELGCGRAFASHGPPTSAPPGSRHQMTSTSVSCVTRRPS